MLFSFQLFVPSECLSDHLKLQFSIESTDCLKAQALLECLISNYVNWFHIKYSKHLIFTFPMKNHFVLILIMRAIITRSWFETALDLRPTFSCWVHKLSVMLTTLNYKPHWKMGWKKFNPRLIMTLVDMLFLWGKVASYIWPTYKLINSVENTSFFLVVSFFPWLSSFCRRNHESEFTSESE